MRSPIVLPDLGTPEITFSLWLVGPGDEVYEGDRVAEVLIGAATVDILSPVDGRIHEIIARPGEAVVPGAVLGFIVEN